MMATMDQAAATNILEENEKEDEQGLQWMMLWLCAIVEALGLVEWLRRTLINKTIYVIWGYIMSSMKPVIREIMKYMTTGGMKEKATQACCWADHEALKKCEKENEEMKNKLFQLDTYIEELEQTIEQVKEQREMAFAEAQVATQHGLKLMKQSLNYRVCKKGQKINFSEKCPHFDGALHLEMCVKCLGDGGVTEYPSPTVAHG